MAEIPLLFKGNQAIYSVNFSRIVKNRHVFALYATALAIALSACDSDASGNDGDLEVPGQNCEIPNASVVPIPAGRFSMGQSDVYPEEGPEKVISIAAFWMDSSEVTNAKFAEFVAETGYVTMAEEPVDPAIFGIPAEDIPPDMLKPGSAVFIPPDRPPDNVNDWWQYVPGAPWKAKPMTRKIPA